VKNECDIEYYINPVASDYIDFNDCIIDEMQKAELSNHFWFKDRMDTIMNTFDRYVKLDANVLDIGAGSGFIAKNLQLSGYNISVADIHEKALQKAVDLGIKKCYLMDVYEPPFKNHFDVITLFDVIEHLDYDHKALDGVFQMLKPGGKIVLTVPAHQWLWNRHDIVAGHKRRYSRKTLIKAMKNSGFDIIRSTYLFRLLIPLFIIRKHLEFLGHKENNMFYISPIVNKILMSICMFERTFNNWIPDVFGGSLMVIAKKPIDLKSDV